MAGLGGPGFGLTSPALGAVLPIRSRSSGTRPRVPSSAPLAARSLPSFTGNVDHPLPLAHQRGERHHALITGCGAK